jgi:Cof subfamily protein (haloacid dehalogenase superfamily)
MIAVKAAQAKGHKVFLCTGRNPAMLAPVLALGFDGAVAGAGGYIFTNDEVLFDCPMKPEDFETGMRLLGENGVFRTIEARDATWGDEELGDFLAQAGEENSELVRWRKALADQLNIRPMSEYDGSPIYKIVFMCREAKQPQPARDALERQYHFVVQDVAAHHCLNGELINRKYDKGKGVRIVAEHYGMDIADTIGFGDSMNDREMLLKAGTAIVMDSGSDNAKVLADYVTAGQEEDGIWHACKHFGLI